MGFPRGYRPGDPKEPQKGADPSTPPFDVAGLDPHHWQKRTTALGLDYWYNSDDPYYRYIVGDWIGEYKKIPWFLIENPTQNHGTPPGAKTRETAVSQEAREMTSLAVGKIPACYGQVRVGPLIFAAGNYQSGGSTVLGGALCHGGDQGIGGVVKVLVPRENLQGQYYEAAQNGAGVGGAVQWTPYLGTLNQAADFYLTWIRNPTGLFPAPDAAAQRHPGLAYLSLLLIENDTFAPSLPELKVILNGRKVYDPRLDAGLVATGVPTRNATTVVYSNNAALVTADYLQDEWFGCKYGMAGVDWFAAAEEADYCDVLVAGLRRHTINIALQRPALHQANVDTLRAHFRASIVPRNGKQVIVCDRVRAASFFFDSTNSRLTRLNRKGPSEIPNGVRVSWVNPSKDWNDDEAKVENDNVKDGFEEWVPEDYTLDGCTVPDEAERQKYYLYNKKAASESLEVELVATTLEGGLTTEVGDHVQYFDEIFGGDPVDLSIVSKSEAGEGEAQLQCVAYVEDIFSDAAGIVETKPPVVQDDPMLPQAAPTGLTLTEEVYRVQGSNITRSRIRIAYTLNSSRFADGVQIKVQRAGQPAYVLVPKGDAGPYTLEGTDDNVLYTVSVATLNRANGTPGTPAVQSILTQTKTTPPTDVPQVLATPYSGQALVEWQQAYDVDLDGYEVRRMAESEVGVKTLDQQWNAATFVRTTWDTSLIDAPPYATAWRYLVKAYDSGGRYSVNPKYAVITVEPLRPLQTAAIMIQTTAGFEEHGLFSRRNGLAVVEHYGADKLTERVFLARQKTFASIQAEIDASFGPSGTIAQWAAANPGPLCFPLPLTGGAAVGTIRNSVTASASGLSKRNREWRFWGKSSERLGSNDPAIVAKARAARMTGAGVTPRFGIDTEGGSFGQDSDGLFAFVLSTNNARAQEIVHNVGAPGTPLITYQVQRLEVLIQSGSVVTNVNGEASVVFTNALPVDVPPLIPIVKLTGQNVANPVGTFFHVALTAVSNAGFSIQAYYSNGSSYTVAAGVTVYYSAYDEGLGGNTIFT